MPIPVAAWRRAPAAARFWYCGIESRRVYWYLSLDSVLCCQGPVQRPHHPFRRILPNMMRRYGRSWSLDHEEAMLRFGPKRHRGKRSRFIYFYTPFRGLFWSINLQERRSKYCGLLWYCCVLYCCVIFCCAKLCCVIFCCVIILLCYILLCYILLCYILLCYIILCYILLYYDTVLYYEKIMKFQVWEFLSTFIIPLRPSRIKSNNSNNYLAIGAYFKQQVWYFTERTLDSNGER